MSWPLSRRAQLAAYWSLCFVATHAPLAIPPLGEFRFSDTAMHFGMYAVLGILFRRAFDVTRDSRSLLLILTCYAGLDEVTQPFVNRNAEWSDFAADVVGSALGLSFQQLTHRFMHRLRG